MGWVASIGSCRCGWSWSHQGQRSGGANAAGPVLFNVSDALFTIARMLRTGYSCAGLQANVAEEVGASELEPDCPYADGSPSGKAATAPSRARKDALEYILRLNEGEEVGEARDAVLCRIVQRMRSMRYATEK